MPHLTVILAGMDPGDMFPFLLGAIVLATPLILILTKHQQKMASIFRGQSEATPPTDQEMRILQELSSLRQLVAQQSILIDDLARNQRTLAERSDREPEALRDRLR